MTLKQITVKIDITEKHEEALRELLPYWQQYESEGRRPFENMTVEGLCAALLQAGFFHTMWDKIKEEQCRQGLITTKELLDREELTVAERIEARKQKEGGTQ